MADFTVLVGNDINNVVEGNSWSNLLSGLTSYLSIDVDFPPDKPFPLAYEEIYFKTIKNTSFTERDIKKYVAEHVSDISNGAIHKLICTLGVENILTTNYDLSLETSAGYKGQHLVNSGYISESKYSIFRKHVIGGINFWHIHGSSTAHMSITLGYEHYSGYLQHMRNYVVTGTKDTYKKRSFKPLTKRIKENNVEYLSWLDIFFTKDVHIIGLSLEFVEYDLWWLLAFREKTKCKGNVAIRNSIYYYIPDTFLVSSKSKIDMLQSVGVTIRSVQGYASGKQVYYENVLSEIVS